MIDFNHRSLFSMLVYLNTCEQGGETTLFVRARSMPDIPLRQPCVV